MNATTEILREYLVALGYEVDQPSYRKYLSALNVTQATVKGVGLAVAGLGAAAIASAAIFGRSMERLYYSSRKAEAAAGNILALEFGGKQIGLSADKMRGALEGFARNLRMNPGLIALLEQLGIPVQGRDKSDVFTDLVAQLRKMPFYVGAQYAQLFGIDPDDLLLLQEGLEKMKAAADLRRKLAADAGLDYSKIAQTGMEYANALSAINERLGITWNILQEKLLPYMKTFTEWVTRGLDAFNEWLNKTNIIKEVQAGAAGVRSGLGSYWDWTKKFWNGAADAFRNYGKPATPGKQGPEAPQVIGQGGSQAQRLFAGLERVYGLPEGVLDRMWKKESGRGLYMLSPKGAQGHFQFMPGTAKEWGVDDPNDLNQSATGAARYMSYLMKRYGGDVTKALAAYNWGMGNLESKGLGAAPLETRKYVEDVGGTPIQINTQVTVHGSTDPEQTASRTAAAVERTNSSLIRNTVGAVR